MNPISIDNIKPKKKLFHDQWIDVYEKEMHIDEIVFLPENARTLFTFERLEKQLNKNITQISLEEITQFVVNEPIHKMGALIKSIESNGVQVPLIVSSERRLLDGNRRFFACSAIKFKVLAHDGEIPEVLTRIPTFVIKEEDLKKNKNELRIIAEANFLPDLKVPWPIDAQARAIRNYLESPGRDRNQALNEIKSVLGKSKSEAIVLLESLDLADEFVDAVKDNDEEWFKRKKIVEDKFVYFWEFRNKGIKGAHGLKKAEELKEVKDVFFDFMSKGNANPIKNVKMVEPLILAKREDAFWKIIKESGIKDFGHVVHLVNEKKEEKQAEDKIRLFAAWLSSTTDLTAAAKNQLKKLAELANEKASESTPDPAAEDKTS